MLHPKDVGQAVKFARTAAGMTQEELAEAAGLSTSYLSMLERGKRKPPFETLDKIGAAVGASGTFIILYATSQDQLSADLGSRQLAKQLLGAVMYKLYHLKEVRPDTKQRPP